MHSLFCSCTPIKGRIGRNSEHSGHEATIEKVADTDRITPDTLVLCRVGKSRLLKKRILAFQNPKEILEQLQL